MLNWHTKLKGTSGMGTGVNTIMAHIFCLCVAQHVRKRTFKGIMSGRGFSNVSLRKTEPRIYNTRKGWKLIRI